MKLFFISILLTLLFLAQPLQAKTVEVAVHGMTCAFCVDSLERRFSKMESVSKVEVSLQLNKVRLQTDDILSTETIKQTILDAGFTPTGVTVLPE
jgi:copper chaperone CopZ